MKEFVVLRTKMYSYLTGNGCVDKKENDKKECVMKQNKI